MRQLLLIAFLATTAYACNETSGKEPRFEKKTLSVAHKNPPEELRVGRVEARKMRDRRKGDDAIVKIAASDLYAMMMNGAPAATDSFVFYFVKYDPNSGDDQRRYSRKGHNADWQEVGKKPSSLLVGYVSAQNNPGMYLLPRQQRASVEAYDLGIVCPPPPDCNCDIKE